MKDFLKIFIILCFVVGAFIFGRSYGEKSFRESAEYQDIVKKKEDLGFAKNDFENVKAKVQNIVDSAENKKSEELLGQILQVFLADLGIQIQNQKNFIKGCEAPVAQVAHAASPKHSEPTTKAPVQSEAAVVETKRRPELNLKKLKSSEWILTNSTNPDEARRNLKNVEIKDMDSFLKQTTAVGAKEMADIYGKYRGRIMDVGEQEYGTLAIDVNPEKDETSNRLVGSFKIFKGGREQVSNRFRTDQLGVAIQGSSGFIIEERNTYFQLYKIKETQQLAGFYYERLPQGTTKTIGSFLLNRTDQF